jgi:hypothetical protein
MSDDTIILTLSISGMVAGFGGLIYLGYKNDFTRFLTFAHWVSLGILITAGILTWAAMVWMINPKSFTVNNNQWISFGFTIGISILWWARYAYTVAVEEEEV